MGKATVLDWTGTPIVSTAEPPANVIAETGGVREPWTSRVIRDVTPESLARLLRLDCELSDQMALCKRIQRDDHVHSVVRTMKLGIAGLDWQVLAFDDSTEAERHRAFIENVLTGFPRFSQLLVHLLDGEIKPLAGVEVIYDRKTWLPTGYVPIDSVRWTWNGPANALHLRTIRAPGGEPLTPNGFIIHRSELESGNVREAGCWTKLAWLYLFKRFALSEWVRFAELYGKPFRLGFYEDPNDKAAILEAVRDLGVNAAGVFPHGTEIRLEEAQRYGSQNLYQTLKRECEEGMSKVVLGHALNADARTGTGMQAGNSAKKVSDENRQAIAVGLADTLRHYLIRPLIAWHFGWQHENRTPTIKFAYEPPEDLKQTAETLKIANDLLAPSGETIDPEFIRQKFGITKTVKRASFSVPQVTANDASPDDATAATKTPMPQYDGLSEVQPRIYASKDAQTTPLLRSLDDVHALAIRLAARADAELAENVLRRADAAESIESFVDLIFETYDETPHAKMAAIVRDLSVTAHEMSRSDAR